MADNVQVNTGSGATVATDDVSGVHFQKVKIDGGGDGVSAPIGGDASNGLDVDVTRVQGTVTVGDGGSALSVDDNGGTLTVDDGGTTLSVDDGAGSLTVDGTVAVTQGTAANLNMTEASAAAIKTSVELIDDAIYTDGSGTPSKAIGVAGTDGTNPQILKTDTSGELQVDVLTLPNITVGAAIPAGNNNIGDVDVASIAAGDNNIGNVDIVTMPNVTIGSAIPAGTNNIGDVDVLSIAAGDNNIGNVDIVSLPDEGQQTMANSISVAIASNQSAIPITDNSGNLSIDDGGNSITVDDGAGSLTVDNGGTFAVQVSSALPSGTNNIGDVDVLTLPGSLTGKAEDAAHSSGDVGVMALGVRRDANTTLVDTTGDYAPFQIDADGSLKVAIISGAGSGGTAIADDAAFTAGTTSVTPAGGVYQATPDSVDDGDAGALRMSANRNLMVTLRDASGSERGLNIDASNRIGVTDGGSSLTVDNGGTFAVQVDAAIPAGNNNIGDVDVASIVPGAGATNLGKAEDAAHSSGDVGVMALAVRTDTPANKAADGDYEPLQVAAGRLWVSAAIDTALPAGSAAIGKLAANSGVDIGDVDVTSVTPGTAAASLGKAEDAAHGSGDTGVMMLGVRRDTVASGAADGDYVTINVDANGLLYTHAQGGVAHDGVDAGNPLKIGGRALAHGTNPTAVAAADRTDWLFNRAGIPWVIGGHPNIVTIEAAYTAAQTDTAIVTISTGLKIVVTQVQFTCDNANTVNVAVRVGFGTANTPTTTGVVLTHPGVAPGSGISRGDGTGMLGVGADNEDLRITCTVPTTGSCRVLVSYYTIET